MVLLLSNRETNILTIILFKIELAAKIIYLVHSRASNLK